MFVLASSSPRRQELLRNARIEFVAHPADLPEVRQPGEAPVAFAERLAREKALSVFNQRPGDFVLGADTIVIVDGAMLGKPADEADAARMLRLLSGRGHEVTTAVCLTGPQQRSADPVLETPDLKLLAAFADVRSETSEVGMCEISEQEIRDYIATGEPMDKAGAYAIQGIASRWVTRIEGSYSNVMGLPVALVYRMLREHRVI